jgi:hypothetical protein
MCKPGFLRKGWKREFWWCWGWGLQFEESSCPETATKSSQKHLHQPQTSSLNFPQEPRCKQKNNCRFKRRNWWHLIGIWLPLAETSMITHKNRTGSARRCIWRYSCQAGVWTWQILNKAVMSQLITYLWRRCHHQAHSYMWLFFDYLFQG